MNKNYLKTALRNLWRYKGFSLINIASLTIGVVGCLLIGLFVWDEKQYDDFKGADQLFRIYNQRTTSNGTTNMAMVPPTFAPFAKQQFPEVEETLRLLNIPNRILLESGEKKGYEEKGLMAENSFFSFFPLAFSKGSAVNALADKNTIVLTEKLAQKYFAGKDPVGKVVQVDKEPFRVTGVLAPLPEHFHLDFAYLTSLSSLNVPKERMESWGWQQFFTYLKLKKNADPGAFLIKFQKEVKEKSNPTTQASGYSYAPFLQPLRDIHLKSSDFEWDIARRGNITYVKALTIIAVFVLVIACFNFVNLATARSFRRAKEIGVRKVIGAERRQLLLQFTGETILLSIISVLIASVISTLLLPWLNNFTGKSISFNILTQPVLALLLIAGSLVIGIAAGIYPAMVLSSFQPIKVLKGINTISTNNKQVILRQGLIVLQFTLSVLLIVCALVVYRQVKYLHDKDLGFSKDQVVTFQLRGGLESKIAAFKNDLMESPDVISATAGYGLPGDIFAGDEIIVPKNDNKQYPVSLFLTDEDYITTLGLHLIAGRNFSKNFSTDKDQAFIINETAVKELGFGTPQHAIGQKLHWNKWNKDAADPVKKGKIIGVIKDFHFKSLHEKVNSQVLQIYPEYYKVAVKIKGKGVDRALTHIKTVWSRYVSDPLDYAFMDESFGALYSAEQKLASLLWIFTGMAIFIGCLGLFGLAAFSAEQRVKEIGIRKVLGATVFNITTLISKNFVYLVLTSFVLAFPISLWAMNKWLQDFAYRVNISWWIFILAGLLTLLVAIVTVSFQAIKAALTNPVKSLRTE
ncbi:FtsX-like permease family protein [Pedobacter sp. HMF7647]|uniref:FtsX-like permease family protein n=1 Tax=Hufsiella arboris TaxID=2695275 RepID=A0A7K1YA55_9SPHI|nr:ABC transporter permease [Hufsiella arboris]MXV51463.1 FtsX-like permease family protein [Hufsiella arboris]